MNQPNTTLQLEKFDRGKYQDREDRLVERPPQPRKDTTPATASADKQGEHGTLNNVRGGNTVKSTTTGDPVDAGRAPPPPGYGKTISEYSKKTHQTDADKRDPSSRERCRALAERSRLNRVAFPMTFPQRYLVRFGPKQTPHVFTDLLVIGGGIAGLRAALAVPPDLRVLVVTKDRLQLSNSSWAQGGIAAVRSPEDRFENHIEDTLTAGAGLCDRAIVEMVVREAPKQIDDLIRYGAKFDAETGREGGHSHARIVHALGDATGFEVMRAVIDSAQKAANVTLWDRTFTIDLLTHEGKCVGALVSRPRTGKQLIWAKQTILASGGAGMVYRETTNPPVATGDGMAAAYRAGRSCATWSSCSFIPQCFTSPVRAAISSARRCAAPAPTCATRTASASC